MAPDLTQDALAAAQSQASFFRLLTWKATIPLEIRIAKDSLPRDSRDESVNRDVESGREIDDDDDDPTYYVSNRMIA